MFIELEIKNELGLHARVASKVTRTLKTFQASVIATKGGKTYDFKNVTAVMLYNGRFGETVMFEITGEDEEAAAEGLKLLFETKFGEN
jgi:phosphocarrier protein HPr